MKTTNISFVNVEKVQNRVQNQAMQSNPVFKPELKADSFNGKTLQPATESKKTGITQLTLEFLGKKKRRPSYAKAKISIPPEAQKSKNIQQLILSNIEEESNALARGSRSNPNKKVEYKNMFKTQLKATPNPNLMAELQADKTVYDEDLAFLRISSLSRYLKEDMVGFITPVYEDKRTGNSAGGEHWFPLALENFIHGAKAKRQQVTQFKAVAKEIWSLIAKADPYWTSDEFFKYLESMPQSDAVEATTQALKEIQAERKGLSTKIAFGYKSDMKYIQKLLDDGCAYTAKPMTRNTKDPNKQVTAEHIFPHSKGGADSDENFLMVASQPNGDRGNMPLISFLKGKSVSD